ncbi:RNA 2',3'-cyclic phosphodiesterase [Thalassotalea sp. LPB0316]|uniref:RNA 2',3'-cyclic phosphodiesterase n=1 Tax=Thalassotalea sp. LPB0316 TaxID=2769490 RepID=UPI0018690B81|nr:RNA 2',3'-cyclic phosphodiesterase [Thalassotalea sp. LPB0316]QOL26708.1 RNA 2',3'-cyclic phosphodiesterase [Thalassotalea sp. LPB0316]
MARLFIALDIAPASKQYIAKCAELIHHQGMRVIPSANYHLTLFFLGEVELDAQAILIGEISNRLATKPISSFNYQLAHLGLFNKPKVAYLGLKHIPAPLSQLANIINEVVAKLGFVNQHNRFIPHISIFRKAKALPSDVVLRSVLPCQVTATSFSLYHSVSTASGVQYQAIHTWALNN